MSRTERGARRFRRTGRSAATVLAAALAAAACGRDGSEPSPVLARNEVVARSFFQAWEGGDTEALMDLFAPDAVYDDFANQMQYQGVEEIVGYVTQAQRWATGLSIDVAMVHPSEHGATVEWIFSAVQDRPIGTLAPVATGREVVLNGVTILEIERGRIRRAADYLDALPLVLQLGGEVRMPGGGVIRLEDVLVEDTLDGRRP